MPFRVQWQLAVRFGMLRRGQRLVTVSHASQREIAERFGVDLATIEVVYEGADSLLSHPDRRLRATAERAWSPSAVTERPRTPAR